MNLEQLRQDITLITNHNKWRRGDESLSMANPAELGLALERAVEHLKNLAFTTNEEKEALTKAETVAGFIDYLNTEKGVVIPESVFESYLGANGSIPEPLAAPGPEENEFRFRIVIRKAFRRYVNITALTMQQAVELFLLEGWAVETVNDRTFIGQCCKTGRPIFIGDEYYTDPKTGKIEFQATVKSIINDQINSTEEE